MNLTVEEFKKLKDEQTDVLNKALQAKGLIEAKKNQLKQILEKYGVDSVEKLEKLLKDKEARAEKLLEDARNFISVTTEKLSDLDKKLAEADEMEK